MDIPYSGDLPKLIVVYGPFRDQINNKQQSLVDGKYTCMYREYARLFGKIIYLSPQNLRQPWETYVRSPEELLGVLSEYQNPIVWFIKHDQARDEKITSYIAAKYRTLYYSCCSVNTFNPHCQISLVDIPERIHNARMRLWFKGKDPDHWKPANVEKEYDYLLMGRRGDKNELFFLGELQKQVKDERKILWLGGSEYLSEPKDYGQHKLTTTAMKPSDELPKWINMAKVGILMTEHEMEGFPQSFLEMTMCGLPVLYPKTAPINVNYIGQYNVMRTDKEKMIEHAELLLKFPESDFVRREAESRYSIHESYKHMIGLVK